jgi:hypothetical protein
MFCGPLPYVVISGYIEKKCSAGAIAQSSSPATERSSQKLGSTRPVGSSCSLGTPMQLRTGHPPSWAVAPWSWPHSSPSFAAPQAACAPPQPCACACGRPPAAVRRICRRGDAALEDSRLNGVRGLESGRVVGEEPRQRSLADVLARGPAGLHGRAGRWPPR